MMLIMIIKTKKKKKKNNNNNKNNNKKLYLLHICVCPAFQRMREVQGYIHLAVEPLAMVLLALCAKEEEEEGEQEVK